MTTDHAAARKRGPYVSEDMDEVYLRVEDYTYAEARATAAEWARELADEWGRSSYDGKRKVSVHDHGDWEGCEECPAVMCWCFDIYEKEVWR